jgi:hypothetical protein
MPTTREEPARRPVLPLPEPEADEAEATDADPSSGEQERFLAMLGAHLTLATGKEFGRSRLESMPVGELVRTCWPNRIRLSISKFRRKVD